MRPNGLEVLKVRVPLGVVFFIYESRPNVTADAAAIAIKSGNAVILRGGKEAADRTGPSWQLLADGRRETGIPEDADATGRHDRSRGGRPFSQARQIHQRGDSARRRGADPPGGGRGQDAGHQALYRQLPHLRRPSRPTWTWPSGSR